MVDREKRNREALVNQINLLIAWNKENINVEPEQVRKNIETIVLVHDFLIKNYKFN